MKYLIIFILTFSIWCCGPIHKKSVEDKKWQEITQTWSSHDIDQFLNDYPNSIHLDSILRFIKSVNFNKEIFPNSPCCTNLISVQMHSKDSVQLDDQLYAVDNLEDIIYNILQDNLSINQFEDHLAISRKFSNTVFALSLRDSLLINQIILVKIKEGTQTYKDSLIQVWYPEGYPIELFDSKFEQKLNMNMLFSWRRPQIPPPPLPSSFQSK